MIGLVFDWFVNDPNMEAASLFLFKVIKDTFYWKKNWLNGFDESFLQWKMKMKHFLSKHRDFWLKVKVGRVVGGLCHSRTKI